MKLTPYKKIEKRQIRYSKVRCDKCGKLKRIRFMAMFKNKVLCSICKPHLIGCSNENIA